MSEPATFTRWEDWQSACQRAGFEGPYQLCGQAHVWQYVGSSGTAALWNCESHKGFVFETEGK